MSIAGKVLELQIPLAQLPSVVAEDLAAGVDKDHLADEVSDLTGWNWEQAKAFIQDVADLMSGTGQTHPFARFVAEGLAAGVDKDHLANEVSEITGWEWENARAFTQDLADRRRTGKRVGDLVWGIIWLGIGLAVTIGTYAAAAPGETYYIAWGALAVGGFVFLRGLFRFLGD